MTIPVPPVPMRRCGREFLTDNAFYRNSCLQEADRILKMAGPDCKVLDFGCGAGRLAAGLQERGFQGLYVGLDVDAMRINWCKNNLAADGYTFVLNYAHNARYNAKGQENCEPLPFAGCEFDAAYAYSVFTHFSPQETEHYFQEMTRVLRPGGKLFLTAHVEADVPDFQENPPGYPNTPSGRGTSPLHRARYRREYFESLLPTDLAVASYEWQSEWNEQSVYYIQKTGVQGCTNTSD